MRRRRVFTDEFKAGAAGRVLDEGKTIAQVARDLDLVASVLRTWVVRTRADRDGGKSGLTAEERTELAQNRHELRVTRIERDILRKSRGLLREGERARFAFIQTEKTWPVATMCKALQVSTAGFYAWRRRPVSARRRQDRVLLEEMRALFEASDGTYGSPRIQHALLKKLIRFTSARKPTSLRSSKKNGDGSV